MTILALVFETPSVWLVDNNQAISNFVEETPFYSNLQLTPARCDNNIDGEIREIGNDLTVRSLKKKKAKVSFFFNYKLKELSSLEHFPFKKKLRILFIKVLSMMSKN